MSHLLNLAPTGTGADWDCRASSMPVAPPALLHGPPASPLVRAYDLERFRFPELVRELTGGFELSNLPNPEHLSPPAVGLDQNTAYHRLFYDRVTSLLPLFRRFVAEVAAPCFAEPFCFQAVPTLRVQLCSDVAVAEFHVDSDYNHPTGETNFWVPLTDCFETNALWLESSPGAGDFQPVRLSPGQMLLFDANRLRHGNRMNTTGRSRVSFDFRCLPMRLLPTIERRTVAARRRLVLGDYYDSFLEHPCP